VIFPEGTRQFGPKVENLFEGAAYVATKVGVPIVPVGIGGSEHALPKGKKLPRPVKVAIVVGKPIMPRVTEGQRTSRRAVHELTLQLRDEVQRLFDEAQEDAGA
jgi:1-acyl-sn-glycerol-3-phosphate acyltransferase